LAKAVIKYVRLLNPVTGSNSISAFIYQEWQCRL